MADSLCTLAELTQFNKTGRADEVEVLCAAFAARWPQAVRSFEYGRSAEGRPMRAMIVSLAGVFSSAELRQRKIPVLMVQGGIHPGESDGKDAGFIALRELIESASDTAPGEAARRGGEPAAATPAGLVLRKIAILFVPAFNTDGHERVGKWNRPNQNGPEVTGWRTTSQNLNLNRDYMKAEAPEMRAMLRLIDEWDPLVCADLHVTDGADFESDVSIQVEPINQGAPSLRASGVQLRDELIAKLTATGSLPLPFYPDLVEPDNPMSGFVLTVYSPRFSTGYFPQRNRFTVLVETHSWKPYEQRVRVTRNCVLGLADLVTEHGPRWLQEARAADEDARKLGGTQVDLDFESAWREPIATQASATKQTGMGAGAGTAAAAGAGAAGVAGVNADAEMVDFRGYAYTRTHSDILGGLVTRYDPSKPQIWRVPYRNKVKPSVRARVPKGGYIVMPGHADLVAEKLGFHGVTSRRIGANGAGAGRGTRSSGAGAGSENGADADLEVFRATHARFSPVPFEGRMRLTITGAWQPERTTIPAGALFVPIEQPLARLVVALLEPQAPDSFAAWGFFNAWFEQKEHLEAYIGEPIAREMLAKDPKLAAEFKRRLAEDTTFASSPAARMEFFHRLHDSWDRSFNLYPVFRTDRAPV